MCELFGASQPQGQSIVAHRVQLLVVLSTQNVSMRFGSRILFENVTTTFRPGCRYGLTGPNGSGKSTLMKLLAGDEPPQAGTIVRPAKLGVLRQDQFAYDQYTVADTVVMGNERLWRALQEREALYGKTADLTEAEGTVVTEFGPVPVSWKRAGETLEFSFIVPVGVKARLRLPAMAGTAKTLLNGKPAQGYFYAKPMPMGDLILFVKALNAEIEKKSGAMKTDFGCSSFTA